MRNPKIGEKCWYVYLFNIHHGQVVREHTYYADQCQLPLYEVSDESEKSKYGYLMTHMLYEYEMIRDGQ